jgi:hypothetical protein
MKRAITIEYDADNGEMVKFVLSPTFQAEPALLRADVLRDVAHAAEVAWTAAIDDLHAEWGIARERTQ